VIHPRNAMIAALILSWPAVSAAQQEGRGPLKVFIFGGQSNMEGFGTVTAKDGAGNERNGTLVSMLKDPGKAPMIRHLVDAKGQWVERDDVWVYNRTGGGLAKGRLRPGYGAGPDVFGPEFQAGHVLGRAFTNQVLILKYAVGGKDIIKDFRPPSSGGSVGPNYTELVSTVHSVLSDPKAHFPAYNGSGVEIAGIVWWHGFNDGLQAPAIEAYETNLANFIKDLRKEFKSPRLPVFITEFTGTPGSLKEDNWNKIRKAQAAAAARPEFNGTVRFVSTRDFVREEKDSPGGGSHHEWNNAETYFLVGNAIGESIVKHAQESTWELSGPGPYVKLSSLAAQIRQGRGLGAALKTLAAKKAVEDPVEAAEAAAMFDALSRGAQDRLEAALAEIETDPGEALARFNAVASMFAGSDIAVKAKEAADKLKNDPKIQNEAKAAALLDRAAAAEAAMRPFQGAKDPKAEGFRKLNGPSIEALIAQCQLIVKRYPGTKAAGQAEALQSRYR